MFAAEWSERHITGPFGTLIIDKGLVGNMPRQKRARRVQGYAATLEREHVAAGSRKDSAVVKMLDGRVVLVTGGGRGIGRAHCLELAAHGATVVVNDLGVSVKGEGSQDSPSEEVVSTIVDAGGSALADATSVTDWDGIARLVERIIELFGRLDVVVNNAGIIRDRMITSLTSEDFDSVIAVHVKGTFTVTKHACDHWRQVAKDGGQVTGRVINTTSGTGLFGNIGQAPYGAAKAAVANLTLVTAMEMDRYHVTANAISPIATTRMTGTVLGEVGTGDGWDPMDPANSSPVVAWLASEDSGWLTGAVLRVEGNRVVRMRGWEMDADATYQGRANQRLVGTEIGPAMRRAYGLMPSGLPSSSAIAAAKLTR